MSYVNLMVTTKQKPSADSQKRKSRNQSTLWKIFDSQRKAAREEQWNYRIATKQLDSVRKSLPANNYFVSGLNSPIKRHRMTWGGEHTMPCIDEVV